jgi:hypothetical protein
MRKINYLGWGILLFTLILSGCGKLERKGPEPINMPPQVFFADVPPESLKFSVNPLIYWYGTDKDGFITAYQYATVPDSVSDLWGGLEGTKDSLARIKSDSASWVNNTMRMNIFGAHVDALKGHQKNVRMYAEMNPDIYTPQHIFLRAVDNAGGISEIKTRMFWRNNHAPTCSLNVDNTFVQNNFYCLPETTQTWKGITIGWAGLDTLDYPDKRKQPDFYFKWELWGPYDDTLHLDNSVAAKVDSSLDSIEIEGGWIYDRWVIENSHIFKNLENYPDSGYGWYQLRVWSRDDAFVSSVNPRKTFFRILKPLFRFEEPSRKTILVFDHTTYGGTVAGGAPDTSKVWPFYRAALSQAEQGEMCDSFTLYLSGGRVPREDLLSRYDLVIALNLGAIPMISDSSHLKYKNYMNVGGHLWIIGLNNYGIGGGRGQQCLETKIKSSAPNAFEVGTGYLGVECIFYPLYAPAFPRSLEFIGATPFGSWGLPDLAMDPDKAQSLTSYNPNVEGLNFRKNGIPYVPYDYLMDYDFKKRAPLQRRLYSFVSRFGSDSEMEGFPCATTYIGPTYRAAEFSFPLNLMKDPGASEAFGTIIRWLLEDLP